MADLKTDYKDDVLDTSVNEKRKYRMITNDDGTVSFEDVTDYLQVGDSFGSADVNAITERLTDGVLDTMEEIEANTQENMIAGALAVKELYTNLPYFSNYAYKEILTNESFTATKECAVYISVVFNNTQYGTINIRVNSAYVYEQQNPSSAKIGFGQMVFLKKGDILSVGGTGLDTYTIRVYE